MSIIRLNFSPAGYGVALGAEVLSPTTNWAASVCFSTEVVISSAVTKVFGRNKMLVDWGTPAFTSKVKDIEGHAH